MTDAPDDLGLDDVFVLDPEGWAPRKALYRIAYDALAERGVPLTPQRLYRALRSRGFRESTRRGVAGFHGFYVSDETARAPRLVPEHSASSYRRGDRSPEARAARKRQEQARRVGRALAAERAKPLALAGHVVDEFTPVAVVDAAIRVSVMDAERNRRRASRLANRRAAGVLEDMVARVYGADDADTPRDLAARIRDLRGLA